jgi:hypothetical protein
MAFRVTGAERALDHLEDISQIGERLGIHRIECREKGTARGSSTRCSPRAEIPGVGLTHTAPA